MSPRLRVGPAWLRSAPVHPNRDEPDRVTEIGGSYVTPDFGELGPGVGEVPLTVLVSALATRKGLTRTEERPPGPDGGASSGSIAYAFYPHEVPTSTEGRERL